jgi:dipeptidyl aminopeptidase/acylaminoacyl peptidase
MATMSGSQERLPGLTTRRRLQADDLFKLTMVGDVAISPDGQSICFVQTRMDREANEYRSDLWVVPAGGMPGEAVQFTRGPRTVGQPRWSRTGAGSPSSPTATPRASASSGSSPPPAPAARPAA